MYKWLYKILFIAISFSFFISATEMDLGESHNTFFDEYDTYLQSEQVSFHSVLSNETDVYTALISFTEICYNFLLPNQPFSSCNSFVFKGDVVCQKIFLRNSVWRI